MSRLDELIQELCPDGVEFRVLKDVAEFRAGWSFPVGEQGVLSGDYPFYKVADMNNSAMYMREAQNYISKGTAKKLRCKPAPKGTIIFPKVGAAMGTNKKRILSVDSCYDNNVMGVIAKNIDATFLYYLLSRVTLLDFANGSGAVPSLDKIRMENFRIPVPPLEVQREIVRILDNFTELTAELTTELTAELTARKKQYEYYRDELLRPETAVVKSLGEICNISAGGDAPKDAMSKGKTEEYSVPIISNGIGENAFYGYTSIAKISQPAVTIAARGTIGYAEYRDYPFFPIIRLLTAIPKDTSVVDTKYLYYCLQGKQYSVPMGGIPQLTAPELKKVEISVPSIEEQKRIVNILDRFDTLSHDISAGLPAEIEARRKQYEYYRDKLLTFKEIGT